MRGIGSANAGKLARLGIATIEDLLYFVPHRHLDYRDVRPVGELEPDRPQTVLVQVWNVQVATTRNRLLRITATLNDPSGACQAFWFRARDYISAELPTGVPILVSGTPEVQNGILTFPDPDWEVYRVEGAVHTARLVPVYHLTAGLNQRWLRRSMQRVVADYAPRVVDHLPASLRDQHHLLDLPRALMQRHFPESESLLEQATRRLAFDELLAIQLGVLQQRHQWRCPSDAPVLEAAERVLKPFADTLPFSLTGAQQGALAEIVADLARPQPMHRLLQGDVGSGKTIVATTAMLIALASGYQSVLMAPTEILAEQHARTVGRLVERAGEWLWPGRRRQVTVGLLTGSLSRGEKEELVAAVADGAVDLVIGTHALIQEPVRFARLGLVIVDEQHRFGVAQRARLRSKGESPHTLVMTATPIPRTLALTIYGDLDVSTIDELPPGRQPIVTRCLGPYERPRAYQFIRQQIQQGRQAFVICPLVEESAKVELRAATAEHERLQRDVFPEHRVGLLHGRMKADEKDAVMRAFQRGELHILVSTAVVEVGVDVPNATVMLIEGADRFGLAQLHQFRGRVGRGAQQSYCLLVSESRAPESLERLATVERTHDGFRLAEEDLRLRGPGEFFGRRQSGVPELRHATLNDVQMITEVRAAATALIDGDPDLASPEHRLLAARTRAFWRGEGELS
ncbi:MAG: ATP-dependent DNA helicase RecG [Chloroflexi bacterium]|nr:ATP-dependent DNA helicase RecG [Chloroflexota bacterium]